MNMIVNLDLDSQIPIYEQLKNQIIQGILTGALSNQEQLLSVRQLSADLGINMHTVNKVYKILENEGFLSINKKKGAFVHVDINKVKVNYSEEDLLDAYRQQVLIFKLINGDKKILLNEIHKIWEMEG